MQQAVAGLKVKNSFDTLLSRTLKHEKMADLNDPESRTTEPATRTELEQAEILSEEWTAA
jgi:hypothetical protein